jgi:hypothetical protein
MTDQMTWDGSAHIAKHTCEADLPNYPEHLFTEDQTRIALMPQREWWDIYGAYLRPGDHVIVLPYNTAADYQHVVGREAAVMALDYEDPGLPVNVKIVGEDTYMWVFRVVPLNLVTIPKVTTVAEAIAVFEMLGGPR